MCRLGVMCPAAHSARELEEWKKRRQEQIKKQIQKGTYSDKILKEIFSESRYLKYIFVRASFYSNLLFFIYSIHKNSNFEFISWSLKMIKQFFNPLISFVPVPCPLWAQACLGLRWCVIWRRTWNSLPGTPVQSGAIILVQTDFWRYTLQYTVQYIRFKVYTAVHFTIYQV